MLDTVEVTCPYCGESFSALIEPGDAGSEYVQDCEVCCNPIHFGVRADDEGELRVEVARTDDV